MEVQLGFAVPIDDDTQLLPEYFPSKFGGKPKWVNPLALPKREQLSCPECEKCMVLLSQIYAPLEESLVGHPDAYHRCLLVYCCKSGFCHSTTLPFKVFRCQLAKDNDFISDQQGHDKDDQGEMTNEEEDKLFSETQWLEEGLCQVCGAPSRKKCTRCKATSYCDEDHQKVDWLDCHKSECGTEKLIKKANLQQKPIVTLRQRCDPVQFDREKRRNNKLLFDEFFMDTAEEDYSISQKVARLQEKWRLRGSRDRDVLENKEEEEEEEEDDDDDDDDDDFEEDLKDLEEQSLTALNLIKRHTESMRTSSLSAPLINEQELYEQSEMSIDPHYLLFSAVIKKNHEQVLRYQFGGSPLWIRKDQQPETNLIPPCGECGSERQFEFQILPQLLFMLRVDKRALEEITVDWGTLVIYTCKRSCSSKDKESPAKEEFLWRQKEVVIEPRISEIEG